MLLLLGPVLSHGKPRRRYSVASSVFAALAGLVAFVDLMNVSSVVSEANSEAGVWTSVGIGLYVTAIGALLAFIGGWMPIAPEPIMQSKAS